MKLDFYWSDKSARTLMSASSFQDFVEEIYIVPTQLVAIFVVVGTDLKML